MFLSWFTTLTSRQKIGLILILIGFFCFGLVFSFRVLTQAEKKNLSFSLPPQLGIEEEAGKDLLPAWILIPKVGIDLPVFPVDVKDNEWEVNEKGAFYLLGSGIPGKKGNVVIYAHNKNQLFGPIRWLEEGDQVEVVNKKGEEFSYKIVETRIVSPETVEVLSSTQDATLTLYTCTGFLDRNRFIIVAKLQAR